MGPSSHPATTTELPAEAPVLGLDCIRRAFEVNLARRVRLDDDFFDLGGDSLGAIRLILDLERALSVPLPHGLLRAARTPRRVAEWLQDRQMSASPSGVSQSRRSAYGKLKP